MKKTSVGALILCIGILSAGTAYGYSGNACEANRSSHHIMKKMAALDLSDDKQKKIYEIHKKFVNENLIVQEKVAPLHIRIKRLSLADNPNYGEIEKVMRDLAPLKAKLKVNHLREKKEILSLLTLKEKMKLKNRYSHQKKMGHKKKGHKKES
ncbi:MAG: Spy/CpxP family protein refolding chaperone [Candidatus Marinamargulisbacteria bacterium]|jgi:Spy/CpxP family protein refolding chaperone